MAPRDSENEIRPECGVVFKSFETAIGNFQSTLERHGEKVTILGERIARQEETTRGLWHELRDDVHPALRDLPNAIRDAVKTHADDCLSRKRTVAKASRTSHTPPRGSRRPTEPKNVLGIPTVTLFKWLLYLGLLIGGIIAGSTGSIVLGSRGESTAEKVLPKSALSNR